MGQMILVRLTDRNRLKGFLNAPITPKHPGSGFMQILMSIAGVRKATVF